MFRFYNLDDLNDEFSLMFVYICSESDVEVAKLGRKLFVGGIPFTLTSEGLRAYFAVCSIYCFDKLYP